MTSTATLTERDSTPRTAPSVAGYAALSFDAPKGHYDVQGFRGVVVSHEAMSTTHVSGVGGGGQLHNGSGYVAPTRITSTSTIHDRLILVGPDGRERAFKLQNFGIACRASNDVTVLWAIRSGDEDGPYLAVFNHTTMEVYLASNSTFLALFSYPFSILRHLLVGAVIFVVTLIALALSTAVATLMTYVMGAWGVVAWYRRRKKRRAQAEQSDAFKSKLRQAL